MQNHQIPRASGSSGALRSAARTPLVVAVFAALAALAACNDESPVQPRTSVPDGGPKSPSAVINILPTGAVFPARIAAVTGSAVGTPAKVQVYDKAGNLMAQFMAFSQTEDYKAGVNVALGDVNSDGYPDVIAGEGPTPGAPNPSMYAVWDGRTGTMIGSGTPYWNTFRGGVRVGAGDFDGDGADEVFACLGPGGYATGAYVYKVGKSYPYLVFSTQLGYTNGTGWRTSGCRIAGGDINGDGRDDVIATFDGTPNALLITDAATRKIQAWQSPYGVGYTGEMSVASGDANGDGKAEVMLGQITSFSGSPQVLVYDGAKISLQAGLPIPALVKPINWWWATGVTLASRDFDDDGLADLFVKPTNGLGSSSFGVWKAPTFATYVMWKTESAVTGNGGPIG
jgi:hypothetical protein